MKSTLWIYGASNCLPWNLDSNDQCWTNILARKLDMSLINRAHEGCDNLYIYHCIIADIPYHAPNDQVVVFWTHPNRKSFVYDPENPLHDNEIKNNALVYKHDPVFFRSNNQKANNSSSGWAAMRPMSQGNKFFDTWFMNYFSEHEQRLNMLAYVDSGWTKIPCKKIFVYFSQESISHMQLDDPLCYLEFVLNTNTQISDKDLHCNANGHELLANTLLTTPT
jgi:hypothetical protein